MHATFRPNFRQALILATLTTAALGFALYFRYGVIQNATIVNANRKSIKTAIVGNEVLARSAKNNMTEEKLLALINIFKTDFKATGVKIYLDGKPIDARVEWDNLAGTIRTSTPLLIGQRYNVSGWEYEGLIDEAVIYARCLTAEEVTELVAGRPPKP